MRFEHAKEGARWMAAGRRRAWMALLQAALLSACGGSNPRPQGYMWYAGKALCAFSRAQVARGGGSNPEIAVSTSGVTEFHDLAVDADGNVWAVGEGRSEVLRFPASAFDGRVSAVPDLALGSDALQHPRNLAFDRNGDLWVANQTDAASSPGEEGTILRFRDPRPLRGEQRVAPILRIRSGPAAGGSGNLDLVGAIAFDPAGNLWATSLVGIVRFDGVLDLAGDLRLDPAATVDKSGYPSSIYFYSLAFDGNGALWASAFGDFVASVVKYEAPGMLAGTASPAPAATLVGGEWLPAGGLAFDEDGHLWVATSDAILEYAEAPSARGEVTTPPSVRLAVVNDAVPALNAHLVLSR